MSWMEMRKSSLEWSIKFTSKGLCAQMGLLALNFAGIAWNGYWLYKEGYAASGIGLGAFISNSLWTFFTALKWYGDIREDKHELKRIIEMEDKEKLNVDKKDYLEAKERYDRMFLVLAKQTADELGISNASKPNCTGESTGHVCTQADVQNCH